MEVRQAVKKEGSLPLSACPLPIYHPLCLPPLKPQAAPIPLSSVPYSFSLHTTSAPCSLKSLPPLPPVSPYLKSLLLTCLSTPPLTFVLHWWALSLLQSGAQSLAPAQPCSNGAKPALLLWGPTGAAVLGLCHCYRVGWIYTPYPGLQQGCSLLSRTKVRHATGGDTGRSIMGRRTGGCGAGGAWHVEAAGWQLQPQVGTRTAVAASPSQ